MCIKQFNVFFSFRVSPTNVISETVLVKGELQNVVDTVPEEKPLPEEIISGATNAVPSNHTRLPKRKRSSKMIKD